MKRIFRWLMNPDNNYTIMFIALLICTWCVVISFMLVGNHG